jgi:acyl-CoA synthetase (AMP-forming)/AMP-acid ligase II
MNRASPPSGRLFTTLIDVLRDRAARYSERDAYLFLRYRSVEQPKIERLTHGRLLVHAKVVAGVRAYENLAHWPSAPMRTVSDVRLS